MSSKNKNIEENNDSSPSNDQNPGTYSDADIARLKEIWKTINTSTTPEMLSMNTSGSKDFDRLLKNIKLEGI
jgi:hypothetical protein